MYSKRPVYVVLVILLVQKDQNHMQLRFVARIWKKKEKKKKKEEGKKKKFQQKSVKSTLREQVKGYWYVSGVS